MFVCTCTRAKGHMSITKTNDMELEWTAKPREDVYSVVWV